MYQMLHFKSLPGAIISIRELKIKALLNFISKWRNSIVQLERPSLGYQVIEFKTFYFPNFSRGRERRKIVQKLHLDVPTIKNFLLVGFLLRRFVVRLISKRAPSRHKRYLVIWSVVWPVYGRHKGFSGVLRCKKWLPVSSSLSECSRFCKVLWEEEMCKVLWVPQIQDIEWTNPAMLQKNLKTKTCPWPTKKSNLIWNPSPGQIIFPSFSYLLLIL